jgi:hypothetical protein
MPAMAVETGRGACGTYSHNVGLGPGQRQQVVARPCRGDSPISRLLKKSALKDVVPAATI